MTLTATLASADFERRLLAELPLLERFVRQGLGPALRRRESVEDLLQSLCGDLLADQQLEPPAEPEAFRRYLRRCVQHKILRKWEYHGAMRRNPAREARLDSGAGLGLAEVCEDSRTPSRELQQREEVSQVREALQTLPARYRQAVQRNRIEGVKSAEIARQTGQSPGAVRNQVYRGLAQLASRLVSGR